MKEQKALAHMPPHVAHTTVRTRSIAQRWLPSVLRHGLAIVLAALFLAPFIWALLSSLKTPAEIYVFPPSWLPENPRWGNYAEVWRQIPFARFYLNTIIVTFFSVIGQVVSATLVAYGFARFTFPGRNLLFGLVLATLVLPEEVTLIPRFILFQKINWLDTFLPLIVPSFLGGGAFFIFLLRQFMLSIPRELEEAAELDGAGSLRVLWSVVLPLIQPALASVAIFSFLREWNDFIHPLIYLRSTENYTLALGLRFFQQAAETGGEPKEALLMAAALMVAAPCILVFLFAQRYFVRGIMMSGLKG